MPATMNDLPMNDFTMLLESLSIDSRCLGILVLVPFFAFTELSHYASSVMNRMFGLKKDVLYCNNVSPITILSPPSPLQHQWDFPRRTHTHTSPDPRLLLTHM